jgi:hypothetical protein
MICPQLEKVHEFNAVLLVQRALKVEGPFGIGPKNFGAPAIENAYEGLWRERKMSVAAAGQSLCGQK